MMARGVAMFVALCLFIPVVSAQEGDFGMAGFDDPPSTTPETSTIVDDVVPPVIPPETTTTEAATTTEATTTEVTTTGAKTTEATTTEDTTTEATTTEVTTTGAKTTESTTTEDTTTEATTTEAATTEVTTSEATTEATRPEATSTEALTTEATTTESTTTEVTTTETTMIEATTTEATTTEATLTEATTTEAITTRAITIETATTEPKPQESITAETTETESTMAEVTTLEVTTTEATTTEATTPEAKTQEATLTEATTTEARMTETITVEATSNATISAVRIPDIKIFDVSTEGMNITKHTQSLIHQISTTPLSVNITTESEKPSKHEAKESASIAVGIDSSIFEAVAPLVLDDKAAKVTTTESAQVSFTTTPVMNTTLHEEITTSDVTSTTDAVIEPKVLPTHPPSPEHPPPIMPPIIVKQPVGRTPGAPTFRVLEPVIDRSKPVGPTTEAPPPPIYVPEIARVRPSKPKLPLPFRPIRKPVLTTATPVFKYKEPKRSFIKTPSEHDPRYMSVSELTQLALQQITRALTPSRRTGLKPSNGAGLQVFFRPAVPITRKPSTTTPTTTTTTKLFVHKFKLPGDRSLTKPLPWHRTEETTWTGLKFDLPGGTNVWGKSGLWPSLTKPSTTTERPRVDIRPFQPIPSDNLLSETGPGRLPQKQLFTMPKGDSSSNIWGTGDLWEHIQRTATTTARPETQVRPVVSPPTVNAFEKTQTFWTQPVVPQQPNKDSVAPLFKPPTYDVFGQKDATNNRDTAVDVQTLPKTNTLFKLPGLWNLMTQKDSPSDRTTDVKSVWRAPTVETIKPKTVPEPDITVPRATLKTKKDLQPLKDLRASQHDIRFYNKPHSYQYYKPTINLVQDNMQDLFLKASLAGSRSRHRQIHSQRDILANRAGQRTTTTTSTTTTTTINPLRFQQSPVYKHEHKTTPYKHRTAPYKHKTTPYERKTNPYERKTILGEHKTTPLTFEELLLRQLQGDASLFDVRRWSSKHLEKKPVKKPYTGIDVKVEDKSKPVTSIQKQGLPSTTTIVSYTERETTQRVESGTTPKPVAAEHPPPIFDSKVFHTFMPFPKERPTTKEPSRNGTKNLIGTSDLRPFGDPNETNQGSCKGCTFVNDRCLLPDPIHCNRYIECVKQGPAVRVFTRECALGSFFDRKSFLCVEPKNADCPTDRCREEGLKAYIIHGHCKHYWVCGSRKGGGIYAQAECCPEGGGFVEGEGCVEMGNCTESCDFSKHEEKIIGCKLRKTASPAEYFDENANIIRPCAPGTLFSEPKCTCIQDVTVEHRESAPGGPTCECSHGIPVLSGGNCSCREPTALEKSKAKGTVCSPILNMTFDGGKIDDKSTTRQHVGIQNIAASNKGELVMTAKGRVVLWRYSNLVFSDIFAVRLRFKPSQTGPRYQTILSNCDPESGSEPSIAISVDTVYHEVIFLVNTYMSPSKQIKIYYQINKWSTVFLIYDGERIVAAVDGRVRNIYSGGRIETRPHPIGIGSCGNKVGLHGLVDDVSFFEDCISDDMYDVFLNVLE